MISIDEDYVKSLPIRTNRIDVTWNEKEFLCKYTIVSYRSQKNLWNLPYEQLSEAPCLSVCGITARYVEGEKATSKFFVLVEKGKEGEVIETLRNQEALGIMANIDDISEYHNETLKKRIIASLVVNALGKRRPERMMYNDNSLLVCEPNNFGVKESRKELVCLKIGVNDYLNLTAETKSFRQPRDYKDLFRNKKCVLRVSKSVEGSLWEGQSVKPIVLKNLKDGDYKLEELYISGKRFPDSKNIVPYWAYSPDNYANGKLFVLSQVVELVNKEFEGLVNLKFTDYKVIRYDAYKTKKDMLNTIQEYFHGKSIFFSDPFNNDGTKVMKEQFVREAQALVDNTLVFPKKQSADDMLISFCEPKEEEKGTYYSKSLNRLFHNAAIQHIVYHGTKEDEINEAKTRRILIDLMVKDCNAKEFMPKKYAAMIDGWTFYRYKINCGHIRGCSLKVDKDGRMDFTDYGLSNNSEGEAFKAFVQQHLKYEDSHKIYGTRDYMALVKNGNVYLIIDTEEIPILDVSLISEGYAMIRKGENLGLFKRKANAHDYLRGYMGFHLWSSDGLDGEADGSYSYFSGFNSESIKITKYDKMLRVPRARRIFMLHQEHPEYIESGLNELFNMVKHGFARWNELMTYPFPFKFMLEYLDNACETAFSVHWNDITNRKDLLALSYQAPT